MKTLILFGSPHTDGDTAALTNALTANLDGEYKQINCYTANIAPCADCRCCRERLCCPIDDEMQAVYEYLAKCDNVIIASPVHYAELSAMLMKIVSRFQIYSSALIFRHEVIKDVAGGTNVIKLNGVLKEYANKGYRVVSVFTNELGKNAVSVGGIGINSTDDQVVVIFEKPIYE